MNAPELLLADIRKHHDVTFAQFMHLILYAPEYGYYTAGLQQFGVDFTTAPQLTPLFGYTLAHQCADILKQLSAPIIFEFGAGSGRLCVDILTRLEHLQQLPMEYHILEVSGALQRQQRQLIEQAIPHLASKVVWVNTWPSSAFEGVVLANEVLDAMPVHRFLQTNTGLFELYISANTEGGLQEEYKLCTNKRLATQVAAVLKPDVYPYHSEVNLFLEDWLAQCGIMLKRGVMFIIDYGFPQHEYYHPDRHQGTLMCHYRHRAHTNPLIHIGEQDITAHVDFTQVAEAAVKAGFRVSGFGSQASFLLANGLLSLLEEVPDDQMLQQKQAVKTLVQPSDMGELFKVIALTKHWDDALRGFQIQDRRASL